MKKKIQINNIISYISILFTLTTLISSGLQLAQGKKYDMNAHILLRGAISTIALVFILVFTRIKLKNIYLQALIQYILSMASIFILVYFLGFFIDLAEKAYRDIFLNYTIPFIIIGGIIIFKSKKRDNKGEGRI